MAASPILKDAPKSAQRIQTVVSVLMTPVQLPKCVRGGYRDRTDR
jgi:hypothetical protein